MNLSELVNVSAAVSRTRSRLKKRALLSDCLRASDASTIRLVVSYLSGTLPQGRIGLGPATVSSVLGSVEPGNGSTDLADVDRVLSEIQSTSGAGSKQRREDLFGELLGGVSQEEQRFLAGLVLGELRQGALEAVLVESLADATGFDVAAIRRAVMLSADPAAVAETAFVDGLAGLAQYRLVALSPVRPMLAQPVESMSEAMGSLGSAVLQYKLDGARIQVHRDGDDVRIFTRQLNDVTARLPEVVEQVRALPVSSIILDGEAIALREDGRPLPFQVTMKRFGRSSQVEEMRRMLPITDVYFDCLYLDGEELIDRPLSERLDPLDELIPDSARVPQLVTSDETEATAFLAGAFERGHEGLMAKSVDSIYAAGNRGSDWLKIKQAHTLDLVVLAAEWGSGRRKGWLSNLHLAARDGDDWVMLGKTFKGLTDKVLKWQTEALLEREVSRDEHTVFVRPELVAEIAVSDIQQSSQYPGGMALRFARLKRYRDDKPPAEADTVDTVRSLMMGTSA